MLDRYLPIIAIALSSTLIFSVLPNQFKNIVILFSLLFSDYLRQVSQYYGFISLSTLNTFTTLFYIVVTLFLFSFRGRLVFLKFSSRYFRIIIVFWVVYVLSGFVSVYLYSISSNVIILIGFKTIAFLSLVANLTSTRELYICAFLTVIGGGFDMILGSIGMLPYSVTLDSRSLGFIPWLREDTVWLSQGILFGYMASRNSLMQRKSVNSLRKTSLLDYFIIISLILVIFYGIIFVQLRTYIIEGGFGLLCLVFISNSKNRFKIFLSVVLVSIITLSLWNILDPDLKSNATFGLFGRDDGNRSLLWTYSMQIWMDSPIIGHGLGTDGVYLSRINLPNLDGSHNVYFILLIETGIVGLGMWLYVNFVALYKSYRMIKKKELGQSSRGQLTFFVLHIMLLIHVMFHGIIYFPWVIMLPAIPLSIYSIGDTRNKVRRLSSARNTLLIDKSG